MGERKDRKRGEMLTVWVMRGPTAEPTQYRINTRSIEKYAILGGSTVLVFVLIFVITIPLLLTHVKKTNEDLMAENMVLVDAAYQTICSGEQLGNLQTELVELEGKVAKACLQTQGLVKGMEKDLKRWIPDGAAGGPEKSDLALPTAKNIQLTGSQISQVKNLKEKMDVLNRRLNSYFKTLDEVDESWGTRNDLFAALPSFWPTKKGHITSEFGLRFHPISRRYQMHEGIDIAAPYGTLVYATAPGIVSFTGRRSGYGKSVIIDHGYNLSTFYGHLSKIEAKIGQQVTMGELIGKVGSTGMSTGPHLHFEVRLRGVQVDPMQYLAPFSPVSD